MSLSFSLPNLVKLCGMQKSTPPVEDHFLVTSSTSRPFEVLIQPYRPILHNIRAGDLKTCSHFFPMPALKSTLWYQKGGARFVWKIIHCVDAPLFAVISRKGRRQVTLGLFSLEGLLIGLERDGHLPPEVLWPIYTACTRPAVATTEKPVIPVSIEIDLA